MKSIETKIAERNVDASLANFELAVNHLIDKVEQTSEVIQQKVNDVVDTVNLPLEIARNVVEVGRERAVALGERIRRDPESFISYAALFVGLYLCYRQIRAERQVRRIVIANQHSWSQEQV